MMTDKQKMYVEKYHDYVLKLIANFNVDEAEFYDELCLTLCEAAMSKITKNVDEYFIDTLTQKFNSMLKRKLKENEMLVPLEYLGNIANSINTDSLHKKVTVDDAVSELTPEAQRCVNMYFYEGYTLHEISEELGISKSVVYKRLRQASNSLRNSQSNLSDC